MILDPKSAPHWNYFWTICDDLGNLSRYVEFNDNNFATYSLEMMRLLFIASSEIDVVLKLFCKVVEPTKPSKNIDQYCDIITSLFPQLSLVIVEIPKHGLQLTPWNGWAKGNAPKWWRAYNNVKHERTQYFKAANLENLLNAVAGLKIVLHYYQQRGLKERRMDIWSEKLMRISAVTQNIAPSIQSVGRGIQANVVRVP